MEFFDFPFLGDFPLKFRYKDHQLISGKLYQSGNYKISQATEIIKQKQACDLDPIRQKDNLEKDDENKKNDEEQPDQTKENIMVKENGATEGEQNIKKDLNEDSTDKVPESGGSSQKQQKPIDL